MGAGLDAKAAAALAGLGSDEQVLAAMASAVGGSGALVEGAPVVDRDNAVGLAAILGSQMDVHAIEAEEGVFVLATEEQYVALGAVRCGGCDEVATACPTYQEQDTPLCGECAGNYAAPDRATLRDLGWI